MVPGARALVAVGAVDNPVASLHEREELACLPRAKDQLDAGASQRERELRDVVEARVCQLPCDRIGDDLGDGLVA